ncbi:AbrB/MazE/SpoVT family DNA-binding domain-containing protein [Niallia taxi]|uniref:AbrB/MazE/SpoVT family DNA-binding domain-containing protein n=1 Tax=Niallia taxi TaxID=2499688 RepID=UPI003CCC5CB5
MKATGMVRRIDQLGRIVIPKEIRNTHGWEEGQPMELFIDNNGLVMRPYVSEFDLSLELNQLIAKVTNKAEITEEEQKLISILCYTAQKK